MKQKTYVCLGDSITCADRFWHPGPMDLGCGYVSMLAEMIKEKEEQAVIINKGYDGFTLPFLVRNLQEDCISKEPDVVTILIGVNDVGIYMNTGKSLEEQRFEENYRLLLMELKEKTSAQILCIAPFIFPYPKEYESWIPEVKKVEGICARIAAEYDVPCLLCHDNFNLLCETHGPQKITTDGIHLTEYGHQLLAQQIKRFL